MRLLSGVYLPEETADVIDGGDEFTDWYHEAWPRVVRALVTYTGDRDRGADAAAEAFARALERWSEPNRRPEQPTTWVIVVAFNVAKKQYMRNRRQHPPEIPKLVELDAPDLDLWNAVRQLPRRQRQAVALRYASDLTERDVAEVMGISQGAVAATLSSARSRLRTLLEGGRS